MSWTNGLFGCTNVKDCGPMCCIGPYCCGPCIYGSAMEKAGVMDCAPACIGVACCGPCVMFLNRGKVAEKYSITDSMPEQVCGSCCCMACGFYQVVGEILTKENMTWGFIAIEAAK